MPIFDFENVFFIRSHHRLSYVRLKLTAVLMTQESGSGPEWRSHQLFSCKQLLLNLPSFCTRIFLAQFTSLLSWNQSLGERCKNENDRFWRQRRLTMRKLNARALDECTVACIISKIHRIYFDSELLWSLCGVERKYWWTCTCQVSVILRRLVKFLLCTGTPIYRYEICYML